ncbi:hypothetical protein AN901_202007 [Pseudomonas syringae pv. theae]|nr:hypothetical protein AN901_202007 [Pseudomonas syringae pv. theae]
MSLKPVSTALNSSLRDRFKRVLRSPVRMMSRIRTISCIGAMIERISSRPQAAAASTATSSDRTMLILAASTALTMLAVAWSANCLLATMSSLSCLRPASQTGFTSL